MCEVLEISQAPYYRISKRASKDDYDASLIFNVFNESLQTYGYRRIKQALLENKPIVALESTIISHGMPYPENVETALKAEKVVCDNGAVPATIAIINGVITVGLTKDEIEFLGKTCPISYIW